MTVAASATVVSGATVTSASLITSRTVAMAALPPTEPSPPAAARKALLAWYRPRRAAYPWRAGPKDPYRVLVSEVMAQQTQAHRVAIAFERFVERFQIGRAHV